MKFAAKLATAAFIGAIALFSAGKAVASDGFYKPIRCDSCTTENHFYAQAVNAGYGHFLVFNLPSGEMRYWHIPASPTPGNPGGPGGPIRPMSSSGSPMQRTPPSEATHELRAANRIYTSGRGTLRPVYNVPVSNLNVLPHVKVQTAHDLVRDKNMQGMLESAIGDIEAMTRIIDPGVLDGFVDMGQLAASYLGLKQQTAMLVRVVFEDGSYADFKATIDHTTAEYLVDTPRTASGQVIPSDISQVDGTWTNFGGDNLDRLANHFRGLGAQIVNMGPQTGVATSIVCTGTGTDRVCRVQRVIW